MNKYEINGWNISFKNNIHMYCHSLTLSKDGNEYNIPCEYTPDGFMGIWPYELNLKDDLYSDLVKTLHTWARKEKVNYKIYVTIRIKFETKDIEPTH